LPWSKRWGWSHVSPSVRFGSRWPEVISRHHSLNRWNCSVATARWSALTPPFG